MDRNHIICLNVPSDFKWHDLVKLGTIVQDGTNQFHFRCVIKSSLLEKTILPNINQRVCSLCLQTLHFLRLNKNVSFCIPVLYCKHEMEFITDLLLLFFSLFLSFSFGLTERIYIYPEKLLKSTYYLDKHDL